MKEFPASPKATVRVVNVPNAARSFIAIKELDTEFWTVHGYAPSTASWVSFKRSNVPWKPWEKEAAPQPQGNKPIEVTDEPIEPPPVPELVEEEIAPDDKKEINVPDAKDKKKPSTP